MSNKKSEVDYSIGDTVYLLITADIDDGYEGEQQYIIKAKIEGYNIFPEIGGEDCRIWYICSTVGLSESSMDEFNKIIDDAGAIIIGENKKSISFQFIDGLNNFIEPFPSADAALKFAKTFPPIRK